MRTRRTVARHCPDRRPRGARRRRSAGSARQAADTLPAKLTDQEFWKLSQDLSEPNGSFRSDNLVSNEIWLQWVIPDLLTQEPAGQRLPGRGTGAELHVHRGPQAEDGVHHRHPARQPAHAPDVQGAVRADEQPRGLRRAAVQQEAARRADRRRASAARSSNAFWNVPTSAEADYKANLKAIQDHLTKTHSLPLSEGRSRRHRVRLLELLLVRPGASTTARRPATATDGGGNMVSYGDLMMATDGVERQPRLPRPTKRPSRC